MFNVCYRCGAYRADKQITTDGRCAVCPECGYEHQFLRQPLLLVGGASGSGKSTLQQALVERISQAVLLDADILWCPAFDTPENHYRDFMETWLRLCKNIGQSGRPVVLFGTGVGVPDNLLPCVESRYFARLHFAALVCNDATLAQRLRARPAWRSSAQEPFIAEQLGFNDWLKKHAATGAHPITLFDSGMTGLDETVDQVECWIGEVLALHQIRLGHQE